jgi:hypothetical protein
MSKPAVLRTAKQGADRVKSFAWESVQIVKNSVKWSTVKAFDDKGVAAIEALMVKNKSDAEFCLGFETGVLKYYAKVGSTKYGDASAKLSDFSGSKLRYAILDDLNNRDVIDAKTAQAFKDRDPQD